MYYIRVREGKNEKLKKEGKMRISILIPIYTVHFAFLKVYTKFENTGSIGGQNLKTLAQIGAEKSVTEISIGEKEK